MLEGIVISAVVAYVGAWLVLKAVYWYDSREADKISARMHRRQLIRHGRTFTDKEIIDKAKADTLHGW